MSCVVFETESVNSFDLRAITMFGVNSKPNSRNPIGHFGTGLKYAIAVLVREHIPVRLCVGDAEYTFYTKMIDFREKSFAAVYMDRRKHWTSLWNTTVLPFTTELGKGWELWQAFRELYANTLDEQGTCYESLQAPESVTCDSSRVKFIVGGDRFVNVYRIRDSIFHPKALNISSPVLPGVQIIHEPSKYLYYRGMRVAKWSKEGLMTYNILKTQTLTEDRTIYSTLGAQWTIEQFIACDCTDSRVIGTILHAPKTALESNFLFNELFGRETSQVFKDIVQKIRERKTLQPQYAPYLSSWGIAPSVVPGSKPLYARLEDWIKSGELAGYPDLIADIQLAIEELKSLSCSKTDSDESEDAGVLTEDPKNILDIPF